MRFSSEEEYQEFLDKRKSKIPVSPTYAEVCKTHGKQSTLETIGKKHGLADKKPSKYRNVKITVDSFTYDSTGEYARWRELQDMEKAGEISCLCRQVVFTLAPAVIIDGRRKPAMKFTVDFQYFRDNKIRIEDFKSPETAKETAFIMRRHLLKSVHGLDLEIVYKQAKWP